MVVFYGLDRASPGPHLILVIVSVFVWDLRLTPPPVSEGDGDGDKRPKTRTRKKERACLGSSIASRFDDERRFLRLCFVSSEMKGQAAPDEVFEHRDAQRPEGLLL